MGEKYAKGALLALGFALLLAACGEQGEKKAEYFSQPGEQTPPAVQGESSPDSGVRQGESGQGEGASGG